jgi:hypothetical protein
MQRFRFTESYKRGKGGRYREQLMVGESVVMFYYKLELFLNVVFYILRFDFFVFAKFFKKNNRYKNFVQSKKK